ncbi:hypothetical protein EG329_007859 [Mollisiaceae sp. DMI_Dod_QoI]|nr:hypothetical protein EG329_007859 [Helotiales sp. DMI_Dod_QoI]
MVSQLLLRSVWRTPKNSCILFCQSKSHYTTRKRSKPLRILFCGSDDFSVASLRALHAESNEHPERIKSIDVLCRPPKPIGRGLKTLQEVPLFHAAQELKLQVHQRDTFLGWDLPMPDGESINLIIAVSFGLFVPPRIIRAAEYGGLNVHPSVLPNYRGSAPLQRMIINGARSTGITLQTLDDKKFDHGVILSQARFRIPRPSVITYPELLHFVTPKAASLLLGGIRRGVYVPPLIDVSKDTYENRLPPEELQRAPKISKEDRHINWLWKDAATEIVRRHRALGPMWSMLYVDKDRAKRFVFHDFEVVERPATNMQVPQKWVTRIKNNEESSTGEETPEQQQSMLDSTSIPSSTDFEVIPVPDLVEDELFDAWEATRGRNSGPENDDGAFQSWVQFRQRALTQKQYKNRKAQDVYHMIYQTSSGDQAPVFYIEDGGAIIVAVKDAGLRIKEITVEGGKKKPAAVAMGMYRKTGMWKLQYHKAEDTYRWFAEYNPEYSDETKMEKEFDKIKEQRRLKRIEAENLMQERMQLKEDLKKHDWSDLLLERHREYFSEAFAEARRERLQEREEKHRQMTLELQDSTDSNTIDGGEKKGADQIGSPQSMQANGHVEEEGEHQALPEKAK